MSENLKLRPNKSFEEYKKKIEQNMEDLTNELHEALEKAHKENPNQGIGGYRYVEEPITKKYYEKYIQICKEYLED